MSDNSLLLRAFGMFSTALVLIFLLALWTRPRMAWAACLVLVAGSTGCFLVSEQQSVQGGGEIPGLGLFILGAILAIASVGGLLGAAYGTWKARG